ARRPDRVPADRDDDPSRDDRRGPAARRGRPVSGMRIGGLCSGYGGLEMAVQDALGAQLAWVADPDPGAARILAHHHPQVPNLGDITTVDWERVEPVDILTAGFPCQ